MLLIPQVLGPGISTTPDSGKKGSQEGRICMQENEEKMIRSIEDLQKEVRELREMVNMLVGMMVSMDAVDDLGPELESNMMNYDGLFKSGKYCM